MFKKSPKEGRFKWLLRVLPVHRPYSVNKSSQLNFSVRLAGHLGEGDGNGSALLVT